MYYPAEISKINVKVKYVGRSTARFEYGKEYDTLYVYGVERGWKASSLDYLLMEDGYRILPWEEKRYWEHCRGSIAILLKIYYGRQSNTAMVHNLVYAENPLLKVIPKSEFHGAYYPVPLILDPDDYT